VPDLGDVTVTRSQRDRQRVVDPAWQAALMPLRRQTAGPSPAVVLTTQRGVALITLQGELGADAGAALLRAATTASGSERVEVDLLQVTGFTADGAAALVACRDTMPTGTLVFRTDGGPGADAVLAAFTEVVEVPVDDGDEVVAPEDGVEPAPA
jgi:hypothetical protein